MSKRKATPLQIWRAQYAWVSTHIKLLKQAARGKYGHKTTINDVVITQPRAQSLLAAHKGQARTLMAVRVSAQAATQALWETKNKAFPEGAHDMEADAYLAGDPQLA